MAGCSGYQIIQKQEVPAVPQMRYERIIKLDNPEGMPDRTLAGIVHVTGKDKVCTDYPREIVIKSLDDLEEIEKEMLKYYKIYVIKDAGEILGYVSIPLDYRVHIWRIEKDPDCRYRVQIISPERGRWNPSSDIIDKSVIGR